MKTPTQTKKSVLFENFLTETGLTEDKLSFRTYPGKDQPPRESHIFYEKDGNVHIPYFSIDGLPAQYSNGKKLRDFERIRLANPEPGKGKYKQPQRSGSLPYLPPPIIHKHRAGATIDTLFIIEGEKKALAGTYKLGLDFVAIGGIHSTKDSEKTNELHTDIARVIKECSVKNVVLFFDADALSPGYNPNQPEKDLYPRAFSFFSAVIKFKQLIAPLEVDVYFAMVSPTHKLGKGLDDLLLAGVNQDDLLQELLAITTGEKKFTKWLSVSGSSDAKIKSFFGLDSAQSFYDLHKSEILDQEFTYTRKKYIYNNIRERVEHIKPEIKPDIFWIPEVRNGLTTGVKIDNYRFISFLRDQGFRRYDLGDDYTFIEIHNKIISETHHVKIQDWAIKYIKNINTDILEGNVHKTDLLSKIFNSPQLYFSKNKLSLLEEEVLDVNKDTATAAFVYYKNGFAEITAEQILFRPYSELPKYLYRRQVQDRDFQIGSEECNFKEFVFNVANKEHDRFLSLKSMLGYLLHDFYDYKRKAINLTDSKLSEDDEGRTGKTLLLRSTRYIKSYVEVPGKTFDPTNKHKYDEVNFDTQIVHLNDSRRNFRLDNVFNDITDGIRVDKKNIQPFTINAKYAITSNRPLRVEGASAKDRIIEFELADHYSDGFAPEDEFGEWFFTDWGTDQWIAFDNFMVNCIQLFLKNGIVRCKNINLEERKLQEETHPDFVEFMDTVKITGKKQHKKEFHGKFLELYSEHQNHKYLSNQTIFTKYIKKYAEHKNFEYTDQRADTERYFTLSNRTNVNEANQLEDNNSDLPF